MGNAGTKIKEGASWLGNKISSGYEGVKAIGKKAWDKVKSIPVLGKVAEGIEKYTPIGMSATNLIRALDTGVGATSKVLQGDIGGAVQTGINYGREMINQKNPAIDALKKIPVVGSVTGAIEAGVNRVPIYAGMSINDIRNIGNAALNSTEALKNGNVTGALKEGAKAAGTYFSSKTGGTKVLGNALKAGSAIL
jgi:hypothetical protein